MALFLKASRVVGLRILDRARWLEASERIVASVDKDPIAGALEMRSVVGAEVPGKWEGLLCPVTRMLLPPQGKMGTRFATYEAVRRCALMAIAVERFRAAHGGFLPGGLDELPAAPVPRLLGDPYGDSLKYRRLPTGYVVYSVGPDGSDDAGRPMRTNRESTLATDETITIRR